MIDSCYLIIVSLSRIQQFQIAAPSITFWEIHISINDGAFSSESSWMSLLCCHGYQMLSHVMIHQILSRWHLYKAQWWIFIEWILRRLAGCCGIIINDLCGMKSNKQLAELAIGWCGCCQKTWSIISRHHLFTWGHSIHMCCHHRAEIHGKG